MRAVVLGVAFAGAVGSVGYAADLPVKAPAQMQAVQTSYGYNWTGFYIGGHLGGAWTSVDRAGINTTTGAIDNTASDSASSFIGGGQIGYNWMFAPNWVVGIEADISAAKLAPSDTSTNTGGGVPPRIVGHEEKADWFGTVRGRLGYAWSNWLLYGTGGVAWEHLTATRTQLSGITVGATPGTS